MSRVNTPELILDRVVLQPSGCWEFEGYKSTAGYSRVQIHGRREQAHRLIYEILIGPIDPELTLDHQCRNRWCVNPWHTDPVSNHENILRGKVPSANRELCRYGKHHLAVVGTFIDSEGVERCRQCRTDSQRRWRARQAAT